MRAADPEPEREGAAPEDEDALPLSACAREVPEPAPARALEGAELLLERAGAVVSRRSLDGAGSAFDVRAPLEDGARVRREARARAADTLEIGSPSAGPRFSLRVGLGTASKLFMCSIARC